MATDLSQFPVPSDRFDVAQDNAAKLDSVVNGPSAVVTTRTGKGIQSLDKIIESIAAITDRGAWTTATSYQVKDLVVDTGTFYIAINAHTSGATFAGDVANWRVYQGVIQSQGDLRYGTIFETLSAMTSPNPASIDGEIVSVIPGMTIHTQGNTAAGDAGAASYFVVLGDSSDNKGRVLLDNGNTAVINEPLVSTMQLGSVADSRNIYLSPTGLSTNSGVTVGSPLFDFADALALIDRFVDEDAMWTINAATGTYVFTVGASFNNRKITVTGTGVIFDYTTVSTGLALTQGVYLFEGIEFTDAINSAVLVTEVGTFAKFTTCEFNSSTRGLDIRDGAFVMTISCNAQDNTTFGKFVSDGAFLWASFATTLNNGLSGITYTNGSRGYVEDSTFDADGDYGLEVAGASVVFAARTSVINNVGVRSGYLSSGAALLTLNTCSAVDCDRPYTAEHSAVISGFRVSATSAVLKTAFPAFDAFYGGEINLITLVSDPIVVTNYQTAFKARDSGKIMANKPTFVTLTGVTIQSSPDIGVLGNSNGIVDMSDIGGVSTGAEGSYTPTFTDVANGGSPTGTTANYRRDGDTVFVWGSISRGVITASTTSKIGISLPVPSNMTANRDLVGSSTSTSAGTSQRALVWADTVNDRAEMQQDSATALSGAATFLYEFRYKIL